MIAKTATDGLKILWGEKFFEKARKVSEIVEYFSKRHHHFSDAELGMALKRAEYLTRRGTRGRYEYIQKHPYIKEGENVKRKRRK
jgi:hypothetical protein